jgi:outer membrane protein assembly factor BamB
MKRLSVQTIVIILIILIFAFNVFSKENVWPQFRGPNCSGIAAKGEIPPVEFGPDKNVLWKTELPVGHSSPCIWEDRIFLTGSDKETKEFFIICLDRNSGKTVWEKKIKVEKFERVSRLSNVANATAATDGKYVFVYFGSYGLVAYDFSGKQIWAVQMPIPKTRHGMGTSPAVYKNLVYLNNDDMSDPKMMAYYKDSGEIAWKQKQDSIHVYGVESYASPVVWENQIVVYRRGEIIAYDQLTGKRQWWFFTNTAGTSTPVVGNKLLYIGTFSGLGEPRLRVPLPDFTALLEKSDSDNDRRLSKEEFPKDMIWAKRPDWGPNRIFPMRFKYSDYDKNGFIDESEWQESLDFCRKLYIEHGLVALKPGGIQDITLTHQTWKVTENIPEVPSPLYYKNIIYMIKNGGIVTCVDAEKGKVFYCDKLGPKGPYLSSPVAANNKIYIASRNGVVSVFDAGDTLNVLARNDLDEKIMATPAIVDDKIYVRTEKHLYAFGE